MASGRLGDLVAQRRVADGDPQVRLGGLDGQLGGELVHLGNAGQILGAAAPSRSM